MSKELHTADCPFHADFEAFLPDQLGEPGWLSQLRTRAWNAWQASGYPVKGDEEWLFTPISAITETTFTRPTTVDAEVFHAGTKRLALPAALKPSVVFVNGFALESETSAAQFVQRLKDYNLNPTGLPRLGDLVSESSGGFAALNTAFVEDGAGIVLPEGVTVAEPIVILYANGGTGAPFVNLRSLLSVGRNSSATIVEIYTGGGNEKYFSNAVTEVHLNEGAQLTHVRINLESNQAAHIGNTVIQMKRDSVLSSHNIVLGGKLSRHDVTARLVDSGASCTINGIYLGHGDQLLDNHTAIDHAAPHCESHELYKGILGDTARGVFNGKIFVRLDAQKTDAKQTNQVLLLSPDARINTKPQLEILADDVKCTHGATVGQLSREALFYLRSRGIGVNEARAILVQAFAGDVLARIPAPAVRAYLEDLLPSVLPHSPQDGK